MKKIVSMILIFFLFFTSFQNAAQAESKWDVLAEGFDNCKAKGYSTHGYENHLTTSYWGAKVNKETGHNCTNYAAYMGTINGATTEINGYPTNWDRNAKIAGYSIDNTPAVGAIAQWDGHSGGQYTNKDGEKKWYISSSGHVAYVEAVTDDYIIVSEDNWSGDFRWRKIYKDNLWPSNFIHLDSIASNPDTNLIRTDDLISTPTITTNNATIISSTSVKLSGIIFNSGSLRVTECGIMLKPQGEIEYRAGVDYPNSSSSSLNMWYNDIPIKAGVSYTFYAYAIIGGTRYEGNKVTISNNPDPSLNSTSDSATVENQLTLIAAKIATSITSSSARVDASCSYTGTSPSSVGIYYGTSPDSMNQNKFDVIDHTKNPFDIWYNLTKLTAGTKYYYQFYAIVDGKETTTGTFSFTTKGTSSTLSLSDKGASEISSTTARLNALCSYTGTRPSSVGIYYGTSPDSMNLNKFDVIDHTKNPFDIWYNLTELTAETKYYYQFYAIVDGKETTTGTFSYTTKGTSSTLSILDKGASEIGSTTARIDASCSYTVTRPSSVGVYYGTSPDSMNQNKFDVIDHTKNPFDIWYNLTDLIAGTKYYFQFYAIVDGKETTTGTFSFTTKGTSSTLSLSDKGASEIASTTARLNALCSYTGTRPSSVGVYYGTSPDSMNQNKFDVIDHTKNPFDIWYNLTDLIAGTKYYYQFYAIVDGKETTTGIYCFTTN